MLSPKDKDTPKVVDHELGCDSWTLGRCDCKYREVWENKELPNAAPKG